MKGKRFSRRGMLTGCAALIPVCGLLPTIRPANAADLVCEKPSARDASFRETQNYTEKSTDAQKSCSTCSFFRGQPNACGRCLVFDGPANPAGHCDSWSKS